MESVSETKFVVHYGSAGINSPAEYDNRADALERYEQEIAVPSYWGPDKKRRASVYEVTTISTKIAGN